MPPISLSMLKRAIGDKPDRKRVFVVSEGTNTEPLFMRNLLQGSSYFDGCDYTFIEVKRTGCDFGRNDFNSLIEIANGVIAKKDNHFNKKVDKILMFFDLDKYATTKKEVEEIKRIMNLNKKLMIFAYTNPAIELFMLMCFDHAACEKHVLPHSKEIVQNSWVYGSDGSKKRYIAKMFDDITGIDSKSSTSDFSTLSRNLQYAINQEKMFLSHKISGSPICNLVSNVGIVLEALRDGRVDDIEYVIDI